MPLPQSRSTSMPSALNFELILKVRKLEAVKFGRKPKLTLHQQREVSGAPR